MLTREMYLRKEIDFPSQDDCRPFLCSNDWESGKYRKSCAFVVENRGDLPHPSHRQCALMRSVMAGGGMNWRQRVRRTREYEQSGTLFDVQ